MSKTYHLIANFQAGSGKGKKLTLMAMDYFSKLEIPYCLYQTEYRGHGSVLIQKVSQKLAPEDRIIVIGGDGTLHEIVAGIKEAGFTLPIGYLPAGTGNDFARSMKLPKKPLQHLKQIIRATEPSEVECLLYSDEELGIKGIGLNSLGFGFDGKVVEIIDQSVADKGYLAKYFSTGVYVKTLVEAFRKRETLTAHVTVDGTTKVFHDVLVVGVMNHPYFGGGIKIDPASSPNNHELATMVIQDLPFFALLRLLPKIVTTGGHIHSSYFSRNPGQSIQIELKEQSVGQVDGEWLPAHLYKMDFQLASFLLWK